MLMIWIRLYGKLSDLADEFDDDEFTSLIGRACDEFYDLISGTNGSFGEVLNWLEEYEEYKEDEDNE
jgi:hypothetical protein